MKTTALAPFAVLALLSLAACKDKSGGDATAASGAPSASAATAAGTGTAAAQVTCDAVVAHVASLDAKIDADGKKLFGALCEAKDQKIRGCMLAAKSMKDLDACDPHPFKDALKPSGPELTVADLVDTDLSSADPAWKGWAAKGPKEAKVMPDGVHGARIAATRVDAFDINFAQRKTKLADVKKGVETGNKIMGGTVKTTYTTDTADKLEYTSEISGSKIWRFTWNMKVSGKDVTCATGTMGASSETLLAVLKASCESLHKK
jgi:hypothetical protein